MNVEIKQYYPNNHNKVFFVNNGYRKHYLYFDNADSLNGVILFCVVMFNDIEINWNCDTEFWKEWLDYYCTYSGQKKKITFVGDRIPIEESKAYNFGGAVMFSGGKDSALALNLKHNSVALIFDAQHYYYDVSYISNAEHPIEYFTSSIDNEMYHCNKHLRGLLHLELILPIINRYKRTYMGIEKEVWFNDKTPMLYNMPKYRELLMRYDLDFDSPVKHLDSREILKKLTDNEIKFVKCNRPGDDFCYHCEKCFTYFLMGCNKPEHGFDRTKFLTEHPKLADHRDVHKTINTIVKDDRSINFLHHIAVEYKYLRNDI